MMTKSEIEEVIYDRCKEYDVDIMLLPHIPYEEITTERIVISVNQTSSSTFWHNTYVKVNWCVPDIEGEADSLRLKEVETLMKSLRYGSGDYEGELYRFKRETTETLADKDMRCHYVNVTLLFQTLNTI